MASNVDELLEFMDDRVRAEMGKNPEVVDKGHDLDVGALPIEARKWHRLTEGVAVVADLKSSTQLDVGKYPASTASIYEAATGNVVRILGDFEADFIAIQGDGAFGLFWGERRLERAITAGITIKTFSSRLLVPRLEKRFTTLPETGFKLGMAASPLLVKRVGIPRTDHQEPVWAGKAVNYAAKCAQEADRHQMAVTGSIWDWASGNDYLAVSCPCHTGVSDGIWQDITISRLADDDPEREGRCLTSAWCTAHGAEYCEAILAGKKKRSDVGDQVQKSNAEQMKLAHRRIAKERRESRRHQLRQRGLV
jgi:class 3 adenylate cyclase